MKLTLRSTYYMQVDLSTLILTVVPWDTNYYLHEITLRVAQLPNGAVGVWSLVWLLLKLLVPSHPHCLSLQLLVTYFLYLCAKSLARYWVGSPHVEHRQSADFKPLLIGFILNPTLCPASWKLQTAIPPHPDCSNSRIFSSICKPRFPLYFCAFLWQDGDTALILWLSTCVSVDRVFK